MRVHGRSALLGAVLFSPMKALRVAQKLGKVLLWWLLGLVVLVRMAVQWWQDQPWWTQTFLIFPAVLAVGVWLLLTTLHRPERQPAVAVEPRPLDDQVTFLYRWYDAADALLYVGISNDLARRTGQHMDDKPWMAEAVRCDATSYPDRASALAAEERAIYAENPRYNIVHNRGPLW